MLLTSKKTYSADETFAEGYALAKELPANCCLLLNGSLGAGKTQFIKGLCAFFGIDPHEVQSPTYSLHHEYEGMQSVHHFDLYRLKSTDEFLSRGFLDIIESENPIFIEWPSKIDSTIFANKTCISIDFEICEADQREIKIHHA